MPQMHSRNCSLLILLKVIYRLAEKKCLPSGIAESHLKGCCTPETFCQFTLQPIVFSFGHPASDPDAKQCLANILYQSTITCSMYVIVPRKSTETLEKLDFQLRVKTRLQDHLRTPWPCHLLPVVQCTAHAIRLIELHTTPVHTMSVQTVPVHSAHYASV